MLYRLLGQGPGGDAVEDTMYSTAPCQISLHRGVRGYTPRAQELLSRGVYVCGKGGWLMHVAVFDWATAIRRGGACD